MKYIRTKDNAIYKIENNKLIVGNIKVNCKDLQALEQEGYKIADTIEELCDAIVYYDCDLECMQNIWLKWKKVANFKRYFECAKMGGIKDVKGAILTNKGLIYVAKMNDKGELELI